MVVLHPQAGLFAGVAAMAGANAGAAMHAGATRRLVHRRQGDAWRLWRSLAHAVRQLLTHPRRRAGASEVGEPTCAGAYGRRYAPQKWALFPVLHNRCGPSYGYRTAMTTRLDRAAV